MECTQFIATPYIPDPNTRSHPRLHVAKLCINDDLSVLCHLFLQRGQWAFQSAVAWRCYLSSFQFQLLSSVKFRLFPTPPILQRSAKREQHLERGRLISPQLGKSWSCVTLNPTTLHWTQAGHYPLQESRVQTSSHRIVPWKVYSPPPIPRRSKILIFVHGRIEEISNLIIVPRKG